MLFLFKSDNSADLLWNVDGASGTLHIPNVHKFVNSLEIARTCYNTRQVPVGTVDELQESSCGDS